jgi:hypothetical protein
MSEYRCVNCGSNDLENLQNSYFITSQPRYQELIQLKEQKKKQLREKELDVKYKNPIKRFHRELERDIRKNKTFSWIGFSLALGLAIILCSYFLVEGFTLSLESLGNLFLLMICLLYVLLCSFYLTKAFIDFIKVLLNLKKTKRQIQKDQQKINEIHQNINQILNIYYCHNCNHAMDLETKLYDNPRNINKLLTRLS